MVSTEKNQGQENLGHKNCSNSVSRCTSFELTEARKLQHTTETLLRQKYAALKHVNPIGGWKGVYF